MNTTLRQELSTVERASAKARRATIAFLTLDVVLVAIWLAFR